MRRRLAWATGISLVGTLVSVILGYPRSWIIARALGPEQLGVFTLAGTVVGWAVTIFGLSLHVSIVKYAAQNTNQLEVLRGGARWAVRVGLLSAVCGAILLAALSWPLSIFIFLQPNLFHVLLILSTSIPFVILMYIFGGINLGLGHVKYQVIVNSILLPIVWTTLVWVVWVCNFGLVGMALTMPVSSLVAAVCAYWFASRALGRGIYTLSATAPTTIFSLGITLFISAMAYAFWLRMDVLFLSLFWGPRHVGLYTPAFQTGFTLTYLIVAVSAYFSPAVVSLLSNGSTDDLRRLYTEMNRWCYYGNMLIGLTLFFCAASFLDLFGKDYATEESVTALRILLACFLVYSLIGGMATIILGMGGKERYLAVVELVLIPLTVMLHLVFTRAFGTIGAAASTGIALVLVGVLRAIVVKKSFGYWGLDRAIWKEVIVLAVCTLCAYGAYTVSLESPALFRFALVFFTVGIAEVFMLVFVRDPTTMYVQRKLISWARMPR